MVANIQEISSIKHQEVIKYTPEGEESKSIGSSFFRGKNCNFNPYQKDFRRKEFFSRFLLKGWTPPEPILSRNTKITAFGSCFAENITKHLSKVGYSMSKDRHPDIYISSMGEGLVNVHALSQQFEWALDDAPPPEGLWHGFNAEAFGYDPVVRMKTRDAFLKTEFFIVTLGLSEIWYDEVTTGVFWRAVPQRNFDESRHKFRVCTFQETKDKISSIYGSIRRHVRGAKVLFTLSPVPLAATFRPVACITANTASKAILRAALDEFVREREEDLNTSLFYFPSYEMITELFFSKYTGDGRHPHEEIIALIMSVFEVVYCADSELAYDDVATLYRDLRVRNAAAATAQA